VGEGPEDRTYDFDAFVSYSHAMDGKLAPSVQGELQRFAKPWYRPRAIRVYLDRTSLSADPRLWPAIERGLGSARWFILLASTTAAESAWVAKEVEFWLRERSADTMLIAVTDGELVWDHEAGELDWARTTALPAALRHAFTEEPKWVDLRWLRDSEQIDRANPRFRECIADLAAPLRGLSKDALVGEHIRHHRRNLRTAWSAVSALALLLVAALVATSVAVQQANRAAEETANATARLLASEAGRNLGTRLDLAQLMAVAAHRMRPGPDSTAAILQAVTAVPGFVTYLPAKAHVTDLFARGEFTAAATSDGRVLRWTTNSIPVGPPVDVPMGDRGLSAVAMSVDGDRLAATDGQRVYVRSLRAGTPPLQVTPPLPRVNRIALSPGGKTLAVHAEKNLPGTVPGPGDGALLLYDAETGAEIGRVESTDREMLAMPRADLVVMGTEIGTTTAWSVPDLQPLPGATDRGLPANNFYWGYSTDGDYFGYVKFNQLFVFAAGPWEPEPAEAAGGEVPTNNAPDVLAIGQDGRRSAVASAGTIHVLETLDNDPRTDARALEFGGNSQIDDIEFTPNGSLLTAAVGDSVALYTFGGYNRLGRDIATLEDPSTFVEPPTMALSPDGTEAAFTDSPLLKMGLVPGGRVEHIGEKLHNTAVLWLEGGREWLLFNEDGSAQLVSSTAPAEVHAEWSAPGGRAMSTSPYPAATVRQVPGGRVVVADKEGRIVVRALPEGRVLQDFGGSGWPIGASALRVTAVARDGTAAAIADERQVLLIDLRDGTARPLEPGGATDLEFTPAGRLLVKRQNGPLEEWDPDEMRLVRTLPASDLAANTLAVSPGGNLAAGLRLDGGAVLLDLVTGQRLGTFTLPPAEDSMAGELGQNTVLAFPDDSTLLSATAGGRVHVWPVNVDEWIRLACATAGRDLTAAEWRQAIGTEPPEDLRCMR
jgi:WD40 repeat protein